MDAVIKSSFMSRFKLLISVLYFTNVESAPEPYCLKTFNNGNCGMPRTPVFHYYKTGSRCEVVYWYGCPTANMFANEYQCSHHCISRLNEYSEPQEKAQTQEKKLTDELSELKPEELKVVDEFLNDVVEETEPQEKLIKIADPEDNAAVEPGHTEEEHSEEDNAAVEPVHTEEEHSEEDNAAVEPVHKEEEHSEEDIEVPLEKKGVDYARVKN